MYESNELIDRLLEISRNLLTAKAVKRPAGITGYKVNDRTVIVFFEDNTSEYVTCCEEDTFDLATGIEKCILKKLCGQNIKNEIKNFIKATNKAKEEEQERIRLEKEEQERIAKKRKKQAEKRLLKRARYEVRLELAKEQARKELGVKPKKKTSLKESKK